MPVAEIVGGFPRERIAVRTQYHERHLVQQVPGARYDKDAGYWTAPLSWATCITLRGIFGSELSVGAQLTKWSQKEYDDRIKPAMDLRTAMELPASDPIARIIDRIEAREETHAAA
jgi:hypothetical protein